MSDFLAYLAVALMTFATLMGVYAIPPWYPGWQAAYCLSSVLGSPFLWWPVVKWLWPYTQWGQVIVDEITLGKCDTIVGGLHQLSSYNLLGFTTDNYNGDWPEYIQIVELEERPGYTRASTPVIRLSTTDSIRIHAMLDKASGSKATFHKALSKYRKPKDQVS